MYILDKSLHTIFGYRLLQVKMIVFRFGAQPLAAALLRKIHFFYPHNSDFLGFTSQRPTVQSSNLALPYITSSTRKHSVWKLWIYFFLYEIRDEQQRWLSWFSPKSNLWHISSSKGNEISPQLLRHLINESQVWVPVGDNLVGKRGGIATTLAAVCCIAPLARTCQSRRGRVR